MSQTFILSLGNQVLLSHVLLMVFLSLLDGFINNLLSALDFLLTYLDIRRVWCVLKNRYPVLSESNRFQWLSLCNEELVREAAQDHCS